jgi:hypothetical protein
MEIVFNRAVMEELDDALQQQFSLQETPDSWRVAARRFSFAFSDSPNGQYLLSVSLSACGWLKATLRRRPNIYLNSQRLRLADPELFEEVANSIPSWVKRDLQLLKDVDRAMEKLKPALHQAAMQLPGWRVGLPMSTMNSNDGSVWIHLQPSALRLTFPNVDYCLTLTVDSRAEFFVSVKAVSPTPKIAKNVFLGLQRADTQRAISGQIADLPKILSCYQRHIEKCVLDQFLPIESDVPTPYVRQSLLVAVPLRLASAARQLGEVAWQRELVDVCLSRLAAQPADAQNVLRRLFFQLLQLELAEPEQRSRLDAEYQRSGLLLTKLRQSDQTLPYNPLVFYQRYCRGVAVPDDKLSKNDRITYQWFLETATLEQVVDLMSLI